MIAGTNFNVRNLRPAATGFAPRRSSTSIALTGFNRSHHSSHSITRTCCSVHEAHRHVTTQYQTHMELLHIPSRQTRTRFSVSPAAASHATRPGYHNYAARDTGTRWSPYAQHYCQNGTHHETQSWCGCHCTPCTRPQPCRRTHGRPVTWVGRSVTVLSNAAKNMWDQPMRAPSTYKPQGDVCPTTTTTNRAYQYGLGQARSRVPDQALPTLRYRTFQRSQKHDQDQPMRAPSTYKPQGDVCSTTTTTTNRAYQYGLGPARARVLDQALPNLGACSE